MLHHVLSCPNPTNWIRVATPIFGTSLSLRSRQQLRHLFSKGFYPASGSAQEVGVGRGLGYTVNVALPQGYTDACLLCACQDVLVPAAERFRPDLLLVSAGFDAMDEDPLGEAKCTADGFARITRLLNGLARKLCGGRLLLALEGGYHESLLGGFKNGSTILSFYFHLFPMWDDDMQ